MLVTDPWITGSAYFGSWGFSHEIPKDQLEAILQTQYVWLSHGHPDHLQAESLDRLHGKNILVPDHVGKRIHGALVEQGFDRQWYPLSEHIKVLCISDLNQDAILLVEVNGRLIFDRNDASDHGWESFLRKIVKRYDISFLLALSSRFGDADMIDYFDEDGRRIPRRENFTSLGARNAHRSETIGARYFVPFSSIHVYQREDSIWANEFRTSLPDCSIGFQSARCDILPAYIRYDCELDTVMELNRPSCRSRR